eukprot:s773_g7.t1
MDSTSELSHDVRDGLNVFACLLRSPRGSPKASGWVPNFPNSNGATRSFRKQGKYTVGIVDLLSGLLASPEVRRMAPRFDGEKTLRVLHAGSMAGVGDSLLAPWANQAARLSRQLCLADRRTLRIISDARTKASELLLETMQTMRGPEQ